MAAPTLVVGLGGAGSDVIARVAKMAAGHEGESIEFVAFDTDANEMQRIQRESPRIHLIQTSTSSLTVGEYLDIDTHARDTWFPVNGTLNRKVITEGAGQIRAVSRLALNTAHRTGKLEPLHNAIRELYRLSPERLQQPLRVVVVSSLCGGTGSGILLPMALYINRYIKRELPGIKTITRGFFLLPEVFYSDVKGDAERRNLRANSYATLRELDAFMMRGEGNLPGRYAEALRLEFSSRDGGAPEDYDVMPYDFCFLFDAQSTGSRSLLTLDSYKSHAATCIYAQSIGPMNERSSSSEDNTIRDIIRTQGRNRYAGAGSSMLIYPFEDVRRYIALGWLTHAIGEHWLALDAAHIAQVKRTRLQNETAGTSAVESSPAKDYIEFATQWAQTDEHPFIRQVVGATKRYDESGTFENAGASTWKSWVEGLLEFVVDAVRIPPDSPLNALEQSVNQQLNGLTENKDADDFVPAWAALKKYAEASHQMTADLAISLAFTAFHGDEASDAATKAVHRMETYMHNDSNEYLHPCSIRYFLYQAAALLQQEKRRVREEIQRNKAFFETFAAATFDIKKTPDVVEVDPGAIAEMPRREKNLAGRAGRFKSFKERVDTQRKQVVYVAVLDEAMKRVDALSSAFETFFKALGGELKKAQQTRAAIFSRYEDTRGKAVRYVCASPQCLAQLAEEATFAGSAFKIDSQLASDIYTRVKAYVEVEKRGGNESYFSQVFNESILGYFERQVHAQYGSTIDLDIISALQKEIEIEEQKFDHAEMQALVKQIVDDAKTLASPFISAPRGEEPIVKDACTYDPRLVDETDLERAKFVETELKTFGGKPHESIGLQRIIFYRAIYGLRARDLPKFAPATERPTVEHEAGSYFDAYYELVNKLGPVTAEATYVTPHIDKRWHLSSHLPDLDPDYQREREREVNEAFLHGLLMDYVKYETIPGAGPGGEELRGYVLGAKLDVDRSAQLMPTNGTVCDRLHEVIEGLTSDHQITAAIQAQLRGQLRQDDADRRLTLPSFADSLLAKRLRGLRLPEFESFGVCGLSLLDLVILVRLTSPRDAFMRDLGLEAALAADLWGAIAGYAQEVIPPASVEGDLCAFAAEQFAVYRANRNQPDSDWDYARAMDRGELPEVERDLGRAIVARLREMGLGVAAVAVADQFDRLGEAPPASPTSPTSPTKPASPTSPASPAPRGAAPTAPAAPAARAAGPRAPGAAGAGAAGTGAAASGSGSGAPRRASGPRPGTPPASA
ncbi:MAG: tubulin-like doman-containing protein [Bifidobacteriaceae bacterium]|jgi:hypothetical protein|nr:tubulin-like doman-containing protein [Bifidobacteriaceae bacterium]